VGNAGRSGSNKATVTAAAPTAEHAGAGVVENVHRMLFAHMPTAVAIAEAIFDAAGRPAEYRIVDVNPAFERLTGRKAKEIVGSNFSDIRPGMRAELAERAGRVASTGQSEEFEGRDPHADRAVRVQLSRVGPNLIVAMIDDVTEARRAEAAIRERTAFAETIIDSAGEGLMVFDRDLRFVVWNPVMARLSGLPPEMVIGRNALDFFPEAAPGVAEDLQAALAGGSPPPREFEYTVAATGKRGWAVQTNSPHRNADGEIVGVVSSVMDVTVEHEIDRALDESERQFRTIFDNVGDAMAIHEPGKKFVEVNKVLCERLGYSRDELLSMDVAAINAPEFRDLVPDKVAEILRNGTAVIESVHIARDGTRIPVEVMARTIMFHGKPAVLSVHRDVSERKRAEEATREQARFLQQLVDAIPIPILAKGRDSRVQLANQAFARLAGMEAEDAVGKISAELGMYRPDMQAAMDEAVLRTGEIQVYEGPVSVRGEADRQVILTRAPLRADDGTVTGLVSVSMDLTDRYATEQALRQSEERFRTLFEHASDAIFMADLDGRFFEVNRMAADSLGYTREELLGMSAADITPSGRVVRMISDLRERGSVAFETQHKHRDGTLIPVELSTTLIDLGGHQAILGIARDISQRKRAEADRASLEDQLRQAQKMEGIGQLAGGIAHDFNNLLTAIRGYATLALAEAGPDTEIRADLEQIEQAADRAAGLTRQLLAFARRTVLQPELVDLRAVVRNVEPMLTRLLGEDVTLVTFTPPSKGLVLADPSQIEQVIVNLAINARDAMPDGGRLTIETADVELDEGFVRQFPAATVGPNAMLAVTDTGTGMDEATMAHLYEPFFTTKGPGKGTGLGLATVYGIVRQSGGTVQATSAPGQGSTFKVYLPRVGSGKRPDGVLPAAPASVRAGGQTATILVVEDDNGVRGFVTRVLQHAGYRVISASGGPQAFELAREQAIGLLLTDVVMPSMSGRDVALVLSESHPGLRVLYVSGHAEHAIVKHGVLEPDINFLAKPFTAESLLAAVDAVLREPSAG
jgi:two-component system, cell cycle sensor histidine kinase and response regulator CckA